MESTGDDGGKSQEVVVTLQVEPQGGSVETNLRALEGQRDWSTELFDCRNDSKICEYMDGVMYVSVSKAARRALCDSNRRIVLCV